MKVIRKLTKGHKSSKLGTVAKVAIPVAGAVAAKKLWDKKRPEVLEKAGTKVLNKTEEVQEKVQKFHDFLQNSIKEAEEAAVVEEAAETAAPVEEKVSAQTEETEGEESEGNDEKNMQEPEKGDEQIFEESEESKTESGNH